jgi:hypothetical protein
MLKLLVIQLIRTLDMNTDMPLQELFGIHLNHLLVTVTLVIQIGEHVYPPPMVLQIKSLMYLEKRPKIYGNTPQ